MLIHCATPLAPPKMLTRAAGASIAELVAGVPDLPAGFGALGVVCVNGVAVPRDAWVRVRPRAVDREGRPVMVSLHLPLHGGGQGGQSAGKQVGALVAAIALIVVTQGIASGGIPGLLAAGSVGAKIAAAAVGIGGALAIAALAPPPSLARSAANAAAAGGVDRDEIGAASLAGNVLSPGQALPRVVGTRRVWPPLIGEPLVEAVDTDEYVEGVFALAGPHALSSVWIGDVEASSLADVSVELREGRVDDVPLSLVTRQARTATPGIDLSVHKVSPTAEVELANRTEPAQSLPIWHRVVTRRAPDRVWLTLSAPAGLILTDSPATQLGVAVRLRMRKTGDVAWLQLPELHLTHNKTSPFRRTIELVFGAPPGPAPVPPTALGWNYAYKLSLAQTATPTGSDWVAESSFSAGAGNNLLSAATISTSNVRNVHLYQDRAVLYLTGAAFVQDDDTTWDVEVMRSQVYSWSSYTAATQVYSGIAAVADFFGYYSAAGVPSLVLSRARVQDQMVLARVSSIWNEPIAAPSTMAMIAVRARNRSLDRVSVSASGLVPDWDGAGWHGLVATSNPAPHLRDVLAGRLSAEPLPDDVIDDAGLVAWRTACTSLGYTCDAVIEGRSALDALTLIAASGYARPRMSETYGVVRDRDRAGDAPAQVFSPRTLREFRFDKAFARRPTGLRALYRAADDDQDSELIVGTAERLEEIRYDGLVDAAAVAQRAAFDLAQGDARLTFYTGAADMEALVAQRGDLVAVQHDIIVDTAGFARVLDVLSSAGLITGLRLDGTVPLSSDGFLLPPAAFLTTPTEFLSTPRYGVSLWYRDGSMETREVVASGADTDTLTFVTPFADPGAAKLAPDIRVTTGRLGTEHLRLVLLGAEPREDGTVSLVMVDEAPQLWT